MLSAADESIQNVTEALQAKGMWDNTLVVFTTDNGGPTAVCSVQDSSNFPRRGGKCTVWQGGTTGDGFISGPALKKLGVKPGKYPYIFHAVDWLPTISSAVGATPAGKPLDGVNHLSAWRGGCDKQPPRNEVFVGYATVDGRWYGPAIRYKNWKLIQGKSGGPEFPGDHPTGTLTPATGGEPGYYLLYNLFANPEETINLSAVFPMVVDLLRKRLQYYQASFVPPIANDPECPFLGLTNTSAFGPVWLPWCQAAEKIVVYS